jgi:hypothetical protein
MALVKRTRMIQDKTQHKNDAAENLDPNYHYVLVRKDGQGAEEDMAEWQPKGYEPARGDEKLKGSPFSTPQDNPDGLKIRGNRILMKCPMSEYKKRQAANAIAIKKRAGIIRQDQANARERRRLMSETGIAPDSIRVEDENEVITK